jgi:hypothetical protein
MASPPAEPPPPPEADAPPELHEGAGRCPRCGTPYAPRQEYCLECGLRLPVGGVVTTLESAWRRRLPYYPGDWIWPVLVGLVIAGISAAVAIAATRDDGGSSTVVATAPQPPLGTGTVETVGPTTPGTTAATTGPSGPPSQPPPPPPPPNRPIAWPAGTSGYTVVLESIPTTAGRVEAAQKARAALDVGLKRVGVLDSSRFTSLHPGYYVVFSGVFSSFASAQTALTAAQSAGYRAAYARQITP